MYHCYLVWLQEYCSPKTCTAHWDLQDQTRHPPQNRIELHRDEFTVKHMMETLRQQLAMSDEGVELAAFFEDCPTRSAMICALLAVLEMVRLQAIVLAQTEIFGAIFVRKHKMFDVVFAGGELTVSSDAGAESGDEKRLHQAPRCFIPEDDGA